MVSQVLAKVICKSIGEKYEVQKNNCYFNLCSDFDFYG